jgi:hypothetical protein
MTGRQSRRNYLWLTLPRGSQNTWADWPSASEFTLIPDHHCHLLCQSWPIYLTPLGLTLFIKKLR